MTKVNSNIMDFLDKYVSSLIIDKYGFDEKQAINNFIKSKTYKMLINVNTALYQVSPLIIFDMWEVEQVTGNPKNSIYIRES